MRMVRMMAPNSVVQLQRIILLNETERSTFKREGALISTRFLVPSQFGPVPSKPVWAGLLQTTENMSVRLTGGDLKGPSA